MAKTSMYGASEHCQDCYSRGELDTLARVKAAIDKIIEGGHYDNDALIRLKKELKLE